MPTAIAWLRAPVVLALAAALAGAFACSARRPEGDRGAPPTASTLAAAPPPTVDKDLVACRSRVAEIEALPAMPGAPAFDARRAEFLGRARGEPMVFLREPAATPDERLSPAQRASRASFLRSHPGGRVAGLKARHRRDPAALRALLLREGYAYAPDPHDALGLVSDVKLSDLFSEPEIWIQRGSDTRRLTREERRREVAYRYVDGPLEGRAADLLFGDRVALRAEDLAAPLHRDLRALADVVGFDRTRITRRTEQAILAELRFGATWVPAVLEARGAKLELGCLAADTETRASVQKAREASGARRRAMLAMHDVITKELHEALRFDRPEGEKTADRDGELRPVWTYAYLHGRSSFQVDGVSYPVFDQAGQPWPPQVCVDFVLDSFERTSGTWFTPRGEALQRVRGKLDFDQVGIVNRRGVMAFGRFAEARGDLFDYRRFTGRERVQFRERTRYFDFLVEHADEVRPGDVVAIHGMKRDNHIHQHAILVEWADPITGFPHGLADQMKKPRRRTWEGIMAEAPLRSLYYRARPRDTVFDKLDPR
jgi:hypothetical protein